jgi:hypothetical protein
MKDSVNFICGCSGFMPLQNEVFLEVVKEHLAARLEDPAFYALCEKRYPVRDEVVPIIEKARKHSKINDVRIWTVVGKHRLRESNWLDFDFEDVTYNAVRRRERLESPLRSVLTRLYLKSTSSKADRYSKAARVPDEHMGSVSNVPSHEAVPQTPLQTQSTTPMPPPPPSSSQPNLPTPVALQPPHILGLTAMSAQVLPAPTPRQVHTTHAPVTTTAPYSNGFATNTNILSQTNPRHRSHTEMSGTHPTMAGQWGQVHPRDTSGMLTRPSLPVTDRHWELKGEMDGMILYEDAMMTEFSVQLQKYNTYVASLSSIVNEQMKDQASTYLARKIAKKWLDSKPKSRWVCWIDASDPMTITDSYRKALRDLCSETSLEQQLPQRRRLVPKAAARQFLEAFVARFSSQFECLLVYTNVGHPELFTEGFLPNTWMHDMHCQSTIKGILLCSPHPMYQGNMGAPFGSVVQHCIEWIPNWSESEKRYWWDRLPQSNLPPLLDDVNEPPGIERKLAFDGRAVALVDHGAEYPDRAGGIANHFSRRWEMSASTERFCVWLRASDEKSLRESFRMAIRRVTHSVPQNPLGNPIDLSLRVISDELMSILMKVREMSPSKQWIMVFHDAKPDSPFHSQFFSGKSNWWNSRGRFIVTSTQADLRVEVLDQLKPIPVILS